MGRIPQGQALLELCEAAATLSPARAAVAMLAAFEPALDASQAAALDVGERDARLLDLRTNCFGPVLHAQAQCPACAARLDVELSGDALRQVPPRGPDVMRIDHDGQTVLFRLPTGADLVEMEAAADPAAMKRHLLDRCLLQGVPSPELEALVAEACAAAAPQADVTVDLACVLCGHRWLVLFDVLAFFWRELEWRAERLLGEVHLLAQTYHWAEDAILRMPALRRRRYLALAGA